MQKWKPTLTGRNREKAIEQIRQFINEIYGSPYEQLDAFTLLHQILPIVYAIDAGLIDPDFQAIDKRILAVAERLSVDMPLFLHGGIVEVAWILRHVLGFLKKHGATFVELDDYLAPIDELISIALKKDQWIRHYDLTSGLVGIGTYLLDRSSKQAAISEIELVLLQLEATKTGTGAETHAWWTGTEQLRGTEMALCPSGGFNLGVAHGISGVIRFLANCVAAKISSERSLKLLSGATGWLLSQVDESNELVFPCWITPERTISRSRLAWCYGDLGTGVVLAQAASLIGQDDLKAKMLEILRRRLHGSMPSQSDPGLCHGSIGIAHLLAKTYCLSGDDYFLDHAEQYYLHAAMALQAAPLGGDSMNSFLEGRSGICLGLVAAVSAVNPEWDRLLLLSDGGL